MENYTKLDFNFDIFKLRNEMTTLLKHVPLGKHDQLCLMHHPDSNNPYYSGDGSLVFEGNYLSGTYTKKAHEYKEYEFNVFNKELKNTYFYEIYQKMSKNFNITRLRIMALSQKQCLTWHVDSVQRIHVPIITDPGCRFVLENVSFHLPADGNAYVIDTTKLHTVFNGSKIVRIHLVGSVL